MLRIIFNHLTDAIHAAFLTNQMPDIDKTKYNYKQEHKNLNNHAREQMKLKPGL